jgi:predicted RNase H-like HicB family nuclease
VEDRGVAVRGRDEDFTRYIFYTTHQYDKSDMKVNCLIEKDEDGYYYASIPSLPGCFTQAKTYEELIRRLDEAISLYLEVNEPPEPDELREFVGVQRVEIESCQG